MEQGYDIVHKKEAEAKSADASPFLDSLPKKQEAVVRQGLVHGLFDKLKAATTVQDLVDLFDSIDYQEALNALRSAMQTYVDKAIETNPHSDPMQLRMEWCNSWALEVAKRNNADPRARVFDDLRKVCKALLMKLCDLIFVKPADAHELATFQEKGRMELMETFQPRRVIAIVTNTLPMDSSNALVNMIDESTGLTGLAWYSAMDEAKGLIKPPSSMFPTINKRFVWLMGVEELGLSQLPHIQSWMEPKLPARLQE